jgi:hypothetical protein
MMVWLASYTIDTAEMVSNIIATLHDLTPLFNEWSLVVQCAFELCLNGDKSLAQRLPSDLYTAYALKALPNTEDSWLYLACLLMIEKLF